MRLRLIYIHLHRVDQRNEAHHLNRFGINRFGDDAVRVVDVLDHLLKGASLHLLPFQIVQRLGEVEKDATLPDLLDEELFALAGVGF